MLLAFALATSLQVETPAQEVPTATELPAPPVDALAPEPESAPAKAEEPAPMAEPETPATPTIVNGRELDCAKYHFEISVDEIDGKTTHPQSLKLCGYRGSTKASWLRTLRDVRMKIAGTEELTTASKARADAELGAEILRVSNEE